VALVGELAAGERKLGNFLLVSVIIG